MIETISIDGNVAVAKSEPGAENYQDLAKQGFRSVVNLQPKDEMQKSPEESKRQSAYEAGLCYAHVPVSAQNINDDVIDRFREEVDAAETCSGSLRIRQEGRRVGNDVPRSKGKTKRSRDTRSRKINRIELWPAATRRIRQKLCRSTGYR